MSRVKNTTKQLEGENKEDQVWRAATEVGLFNCYRLFSRFGRGRGQVK